ncbi:MAG: hypothetical protein KKB50_14685 [Planctomycetes bacterium]|nr:hypothetical protein [Planctomycetota bacterium]
MSEQSEHLEHLISRFLDGECTSAERRELNAAMRSDPTAQAAFEEYAALDREVAHAMRRALGYTLRVPAGRGIWAQIGRAVALAAAACLAVMVWLGSPNSVSREDPRQARQGASWFAPATRTNAVPRAEKPAYDRPAVRMRHTQRDWIVIPGERPGEYLLIEVDRVHTRMKGIQRDF